MTFQLRPQRPVQFAELFHHPVLDVLQGRLVVLDTRIARDDGNTARLVVVKPLPVQSFTELRFDGFAFEKQVIEQRLVGFFVQVQVELDSRLGVPVE